MECKKILFTFLLFLPYLVMTENSAMLEYTPEDFKRQIKLMDGNFVMFYAPWCKHCTDFQPIWEELAELVNTPDSNFAIAQMDCTVHSKFCNENDIKGYPSLLYFFKNSLNYVEYKGTRDMPSLTLFLSEVFNMKDDKPQAENKDGVVVYGGVAYLTDNNIEKFVSTGQHFILFYAPWCKQCQRLAPHWSNLGVYYTHNEYINIGKINCQQHPVTCQNFDVKFYPSQLWIADGRIMGQAFEEDLEGLKSYVEMMMLSENHDPDKFARKRKQLPVARITEDTFDNFLDNELVFINYFAPWCAHCMQLSPLWQQLGERFENDSRVLIADVDCASSKHICPLDKIDGLPTLVLYKHKKIVTIETGTKPLDTLIAMVNDQLDGTKTKSSTDNIKESQVSHKNRETTEERSEEYSEDVKNKSKSEDKIQNEDKNQSESRPETDLPPAKDEL